MFAVLQGDGIPGVRRACTTAMTLLAVQFCVGMIINLYVPVPAGDATASYVSEIETAPAFLTVHALLGLALLAAGAVLVLRANGAGSTGLTAAATAGLAALLGAFAAGEVFVRNGQNGTSLWMALLTGVALLCYVAVQGMAIRLAGRGDDRGTPVPARQAGAGGVEADGRGGGRVPT